MTKFKIALLIDADNISAKHIDNILNELSKYGTVTIRRMYGDWSSNILKPWLEKAASFSLTPIMQSNDVSKKNSSDIGLVIDAMDILYSGKVDGFCIVSSDSDFNKLAKRLRESGNLVIGIGEEKTPKSFRASCEKFISLDIIGDDMETDESKDEISLKSIFNNEKSFTNKSIIENTIVNMFLDNNTHSIDLAHIGNRLNNVFPDFDVRNYGYSKLSEFLKEFSNFSINQESKHFLVSLKDTHLKSIPIIEGNIKSIYKEKNTSKINIGELKQELLKTNPSLNTLIKQSGVSKFSVFLEKKINIINIKDNHAILIKSAKK